MVKNDHVMLDSVTGQYLYVHKSKCIGFLTDEELKNRTGILVPEELVILRWIAECEAKVAVMEKEGEFDRPFNAPRRATEL